MKRGNVYLANLDPTKGSEQAGTRPVLIFQNDLLNRITHTVVVIPFTTTLKRAELPSCLLVHAGDGGLRQDSVVLCHQIRVLDTSRLTDYWGALKPETLAAVDKVVAYTLGMEE